MIKLIENNLIEIIKHHKTISQAAKDLGVSRPTIYNWITRYEQDGKLGLIDDSPGPKIGSKIWNKTNETTEKLVIEYLRGYPELGPVGIRDKLRYDNNILLNSTTIRRIGKRNHIRYGINKGVKQKRERTLYSISVPGELQVDVSYPFGRSKHIWSYDAIDDCTRFVYSDIVEEYGVLESIEFIKEVLKRMPFKIHTIRTDNGKEFGKQFTEYLESIGIKHIKNEPYTPQHNGKIERYHSTRKRLEVIRWEKDMDLEELKYRNRLWIDFYNNRKHYGLGMEGLTPLQKLTICLFYDQSVNLSMQQNTAKIKPFLIILIFVGFFSVLKYKNKIII